MASWMRRLFHQWRDTVPPVERGQDWGYMGRAAGVVVDDEYRLEVIREACTARERMAAANVWLLKLARNGERAFDAVGDPAILDAVDNALDHVASEMLATAGELRDSLRDGHWT